jgi:hypothetical protein
MTPGQLALGALLVAALLWTFLGYGKRYGAGSPRQRLFRTLGVVVLDLLLILLVAYPRIDFGSGVDPRFEAVRRGMFLISCILLLFGLLCIVLLDALESYVLVRREQRTQVNEAILREIEQTQKKAQAKAAERATTNGAPPPADNASNSGGADA